MFSLFTQKYRTLLAFSSLSLIFLFIGLFIGNKSSQKVGMSDNCPPDLTFVKPEQDCESFQENVDKIRNIQDSVRRQVRGYLETARIDRISVFVRDLDSQKFAYVNETEEFYMASLVKVPLAIAYLRLAELTPDLLSQKIVYDGKIDLSLNQTIKPAQKLLPGTYSVDELLTKALVDSDNNAAQLLSENFVSFEYLQKILFTLGLTSKEKDPSQNKVTARTYAGIFRTLYNSSFLSREYSNKILDSLSKSSFTNGVTALLPKNIKVAHKFAERSVVDPSGTITARQLHDCGIVYANNGTQAYSFCIMTEGKNFEDLTSVIQNVSKTIYQGIINE